MYKQLRLRTSGIIATFRGTSHRYDQVSAHRGYPRNMEHLYTRRAAKHRYLHRWHHDV